MPDVAAGIEVEGEPTAPRDVNTDDGFEAALAQQVGADHPEREEQSETFERYDRRKESADDILGGFETTQTLDVKDGLEVKVPPSEEERERARMRTPEWQAEHERRNDEILGGTAESRAQEKAEQEYRTQADRDELAGRRFTDKLTAATSESDIGIALRDLRTNASEDSYLQTRTALAVALSGVDPHRSDVSEADFQHYLDTDEHLDALVGQIDQLEQAVAVDNGLRAINKNVAERWPAEQKKVLKTYFRDQGVTTEQEAQRRLAAVNETAAGMKLDLGAIPPDSPEFLRRFAEIDANNEIAAQMSTERALHASILEADDRTIEGGLTILSGGVRINPSRDEGRRALGAPLEELAYDQRFHDRVNGRLAKGRVTTVGDVRRAVREDSVTSVAHGFTGPDGKPLSYADAAAGGVRGAAQRNREEQQRKARERTLGLGR